MPLTDTPPDVARRLAGVYRQMSPARKWQVLAQMQQEALALHAAGVRLRSPGATAKDIREHWIHVNLGFPLPVSLPEATMDDPLPALQDDLRRVIVILTQLGIAYALGGSMASSVHGISRYTRDADLTVEPFSGKETQLIASLGPDYYVSSQAVQDALRRRATFNILNTTTGFKADLFICKDEPFEQMALQRRIPIDLFGESGEPVYVHTAEDIILFKLRWYRLGNEASEQQWRDVLGVLQVQAGRLDDAHLDHWAALLGVADLLGRARQESITPA